jgi:BTB/POZ domain
MYPNRLVSDHAGTEVEQQWIGADLRIEASEEAVQKKSMFHVKLSVLDQSGGRFQSKKFHEELNNEVGGWSTDDFCRLTDVLNPVNRLLTGDTLSVQCQINELPRSGREFTGVCDCVDEEEFSVSRSHLLQQLLFMGTSGKHSDVILCVREFKFAAHKCILAARSRVFETLFQLLPQSSIFRVPNVDAIVFRKLLIYIYSGWVTEIDCHAKELLAAAHIYQIWQLKNICERQLSKALSMDSAMEMLIFADRHSALTLKKCVIEFIKLHACEAPSGTEEKVTASHTHLVRQLLDSF